MILIFLIFMCKWYTDSRQTLYQLGTNIISLEFFTIWNCFDVVITCGEGLNIRGDDIFCAASFAGIGIVLLFFPKFDLEF